MRAAAITAVFLSVAGIGAACAGPQFTADAVETAPGRDMRYVRLLIGEKGSRFEFQMGGQPVVEIVLPSEGKVLTLFPLNRTYLEGQTEIGVPFADSRASSPCQPPDGAECKMEEGPAAAGSGASMLERWVIVHKGVPGEERVWWDTQRKMAVRQEYADGREMQATMLGTMPFENRLVENWEVLFLMPNGMYQRGFSLFAPDLGIAVAERQPGGVERELRNIQPGAPDAKLFEVPEGYKRIDTTAPAAPAQMQRASGAAGVPQPEMAPYTAPQPMFPPQVQGQPQGAMPMQQAAVPPQLGVAPVDASRGQMMQQGMQQQAAPAMALPPMMPAPAAMQPMTAPVPPSYPDAFGSSWAPRSEPPKPGAGGIVWQAQPGLPPFVNEAGATPPAAAGASPNAMPPIAPYGWQFGPAPQLQHPEQQAPVSDVTGKP